MPGVCTLNLFIGANIGSDAVGSSLLPFALCAPTLPSEIHNISRHAHAACGKWQVWDAESVGV